MARALGQYVWKELALWVLGANVLFLLGRFTAGASLNLFPAELLTWFTFTCVSIIQARTINDFYEFEQDIANARKVVSQASCVESENVYKRYLGLTTLLTSMIILAFCLLAGLQITILGVMGLSISWLYSSSMFHFKERPGLDTVTCVAGGIVIMFAGFVVHQPIMQFPWLFLIAVVLILGSMYMVCQTVDIKADMKAGLRTTPIILGIERTVLLSVVMFVFANLLIVTMCLIDYLPLSRRILCWSWPSLAGQVYVMLRLLTYPYQAVPTKAIGTFLAVCFFQLLGVLVMLLLQII
jgi:4-hydroxybenzoate polyprenyltransferase